LEKNAMTENELRTILSDETNVPTRGELFSQRRKLEAELTQQQATAEKELLPLKTKRDEAAEKLRLASIAFNNADLAHRDKENGLKNSVSALNARLRDSAPAAITRLLAHIHDRRTTFQEYPHNIQLRREHRGILGGRTMEEQSCEAWVSDSVKKFLELQNRGEGLCIADCENLDGAIAEIFAAIPDPNKPQYETV
jgi:hypothetical protein